MRLDEEQEEEDADADADAGVAMLGYHRIFEFRSSLVVATQCGLVGEFDSEVESITTFTCAALVQQIPWC